MSNTSVLCWQLVAQISQKVKGTLSSSLNSLYADRGAHTPDQLPLSVLSSLHLWTHTLSKSQAFPNLMQQDSTHKYQLFWYHDSAGDRIASVSRLYWQTLSLAACSQLTMWRRFHYSPGRALFESLCVCVCNGSSSDRWLYCELCVCLCVCVHDFEGLLVCSETFWNFSPKVLWSSYDEWPYSDVSEAGIHFELSQKALAVHALYVCAYVYWCLVWTESLFGSDHRETVPLWFNYRNKLSWRGNQRL